MISWIQRTLQLHFRVIFFVLLAVVIVSFVFTIGASPGIGRADQRGISRPFFGLNLASAEDQQRLVRDAGLSINLQAGYMALDSNQLQDYALQRYAALHLADELRVPAPTKEQMTEQLRNMRAFAGETGEFDNVRYNEFRASLKTNPNLREGDVSRVLADDWRVERVQTLLGGPGYVLPSEVKTQLARADSTWTIAVATVDYSAFAPDVKPTDADLAKFFEENSFRYELPPRVSVSRVEFRAADFIGQVNVSEQEAQAYYQANPARFPKPSTEAVPTPQFAGDSDFDAVRPQVVAALKLERARRLATKAASDLSFALFESRGKVSPGPSLDELLRSRNLVAQPLAPFTRAAGPAELPGSPEIAAEAFKLGEERYFSDAVSVPHGAVVLFWHGTEPSRTPALAEVREKVAADFVEGEKRRRFTELGRTLRNEIDARLKAGDDLEKAAATVASARNVKIDTKTFGPFTLRQPPQDLDYSLLGSIERLQKGQLSEMILTQDKGQFVQAVEKQLPDLSDSNPQFASTRSQLASFAARLNANAYLSELVEQELKKSEPRVTQ